MAISANQLRRDVIRQVTEAVQRSDWVEVVDLMNRGHLSNIPQKLKRWVLVQTTNRCHDRCCLELLVEHCDDDLKDVIMSKIVRLGHMWPVVGDVLRRGVSDAQCRWAIGEACQRASEEEVILHILPNCADDQLGSALTLLVGRCLWKAVGTVLRRGVSDSQYRWTIDEACKLAPEDTVTYCILPHCANNQLDSVLTLLVERGLWKAVGIMLQRGITMSKHKWAIEEACKHASEETIIDYILSQCADNQIDSALKQMVDRGLWKVVGILLQRGVPLSTRKWVIDEACKHAPDDKFTDYMVPHCDDNQLDFVLTSLVERGVWDSVGMVLERSVSYQQHGGWTNDEAWKRVSEQDITLDMLRRRTDSQMDSVLTPLVERGLWWSVGTVLQRGVNDSQHRWAIDEACKQASDEEITAYILLHCADDQLDTVLTPLVERGLWMSVGTVLQRGVSDSKHRWVIDEACKRASVEEITRYILPHCADNQMDSVLASVVERGLWAAVGTVLERGVSDSQQRMVTDEACKHASDENITRYILPHCADNQLDTVLVSLVERGLWTAVMYVVNRGVSDSQLGWAIDEACKHASQNEIMNYITFAPDNQLDSVLTPLVERGLWAAVAMVLRRGVSDPQRRWAIDEACKHASQNEIMNYIHLAAYNELDSVLTPLVERGLWEAVAMVLQRGVSDPQCRWAIDEACKHASQKEIMNYIHLVAVNQRDSVLTPLVERGLWEAVAMVLRRGVSYPQRRWAIDEACKHASQKEIMNYITFAPDNQLDSVLTPLVERGLWEAVAMVLQRGVSDPQCRWAIDEACKHASQNEIMNYIHLVAVNQLDSVLTPLVERGRWEAVAMVLRRGVSDPQRRWAIDEACKHASQKEIMNYITFAPDNQLDSVLTPLVERGLWEAVAMVLQRGVSDPQRRWATDEECKHASHEEIINYILSLAADNQLDSVLTPLVERGLWEAVAMVLRRGVSDPQRMWAIDEACKHASHEEIINYILSLAADNELDSVLTSLVERGRWEAVAMVLQRGVSDSQRMWAIDEACKHASQKKIINYILSLSADNELDSMLTPLVERGLWEAVAMVLQRGVSDPQRRWAIDEACKYVLDETISNCILPLVADNLIDSMLLQLAERGLWKAVLTVLERGACCDSQCRWAIGEACKRANDADVEQFITPKRPSQVMYDGANYFLTPLIIRGQWRNAAMLLFGVIRETLHRWAVVGDNTEPHDDAAFWNMVRNPWYGGKDLSELYQNARCQPPGSLSFLSSRELSEVLFESVTESVIEAWCTTEQRRKEYKSTTGPSELVLRLHSEIDPRVCSSTPDTEDRDSVFSKLLPCLRPLCDELRETTKYGDRKHPFFAVHFFKSLIKHNDTTTQWTDSSEGILMILATVPVVPDVQSVSLRVLLRHKRWDVISHACLSHVWEQVRRQLFQAAVEQRQWSAVKRWADHSLYDDQRGWALEEAFQEKQWDVFLLLADYGLVESELMCVHYRLAKHADWDTVLQLFERGGDVTDVKELLTGAKSRKAAYDKNDALKRKQRVFELGGLESDLNARKTALKTLKRAAKQGDWSVVLFSLQRTPVVHHVYLALKAAVANGVWHVVRQLIKLGIEDAQRDSLFTRMVKQRQWGVCMVLLEQGVSVELCLTALPELMDMDQWTLVARVMMYDVDDAVRRQVMQRAMERKQGTVVWQCVITMHGDRLSVEERKELFQEALSREVLQAIKPLIEIQDVTGIQHRDSVLPEAAEQHQWDVVDHCQLHHADIDMKDAEGHTPMQRAARKEDWEAVKALTKRGADPSLLDSGGESVLHRAISANQWDIVKLLIQFHGNIHQVSKYPSVEMYQTQTTPLGMLITAYQGEIIEQTLMWCPDQWKGVSWSGETALHAVCLSGCPSALYYLVARGVDPQAVTESGHSALAYAVLCKECPQKMVAECIRLGFCAYQPHITDTERRLIIFLNGDDLPWSPVLLAVSRGLPVVTRMLYESGSCSYTESFKLRTYLPAIVSANRGRDLQETFYFLVQVGFRIYQSISVNHLQKQNRKTVEASVRYLMKVCSTPRSLKSSCRLVISRCVTVCRQRHRDATYAQLPLTEELRNYVMFSDLTDPDYGQHETDPDYDQHETEEDE